MYIEYVLTRQSEYQEDDGALSDEAQQAFVIALPAAEVELVPTQCKDTRNIEAHYKKRQTKAWRGELERWWVERQGQ